jgi:LPS-assembly lipoprotein
MIKRGLQYALISWMTLLLMGCGFHLRQPQPLPPPLKILYVDTADPYSKASVQLRQLLRNMDVYLVNNRDEAPITLYIFNESFVSTTASKSTSAKTQQYRLNFTIAYELQDAKGVVIFGPKVLHSNRIYTVQEDQILSSSNETDTLHREMQNDSVYQIINGLSSQSVAQAISDYEDKARTAPSAPL